MSGNETWARALAGRMLPGEKFRWELYSQVLTSVLNPSKPWLDLGCGHSDFIAEHAGRASPAVGVDLMHGSPPPGLFAVARIERLPFADNTAGTISLRFVLEHIENPEELWRECLRVLAPGGRLLLITTNKISPAVIAARLLPSGLKTRLIGTLFDVTERDVFPTFHRWNSPGRLVSPPPGFSLERVEYVEALDWTRRPLFLAQMMVAKLSRPSLLRKFRSNVLVVYRKDGGPE